MLIASQVEVITVHDDPVRPGKKHTKMLVALQAEVVTVHDDPPRPSMQWSFV
jgi:hypothetical protein